MKRPMLFVATLYLAGIVLANGVASQNRLLPFWPLLVCTVLSAIAAVFWSRIRTGLLALTLVLAGVTNFWLTIDLLSPIDIRRQTSSAPQLVTIRGRLLETPLHRIYSHQDEVTHRTQAEIRLEAVRFENSDWHPAHGAVAVSTSGNLGTNYFQGLRVEIGGVMRAPSAPAAPGGFDYASFLRRHGIHRQIQCSVEDWRRLDSGNHAPAADQFATWARSALARGLPEEDQPLQLLWAMVLGWRTALSGEVSEPFMRSGTMHVFAISGLHIALIAWILVAALRVCRLPRRYCALVVIPIIWLYTGATGWQASAIRSTIMTSVIVAGWLLTRPADLVNSLCAAAFIILLWDPQQLFQAGFQLSFAVVLSLALIGPILDGFRKRLFQYDPWVPDELRPAWQRRLRGPIDYLTTSFAVSLAAWLGSLPLVAAYFNLLTPVSLLANLVVVPLSSGALACSLGSLAIGPFVPIAGELFNHSAWFFMVWMIRASEWAAALPGGCFNVGTPGPLFFVIYYGALVGALSGLLQRRRWRLCYGGSLAALTIVWLGLHLHWRGETRLTVLPMNGGGSLHLASPRPEENWLIDCGDDSSALHVLKPYLRSQGVNHLDNFLITHGDVHHAGGAAALRSAFHLDRVWFSAVPFRSPIYREAQRILSEPPLQISTVHRDQEVAPWKILHPDDSDRMPQADDNAVVLLGSLGATRVLLLSDLGKPGQNRLLSRYPDLHADIVITGIPSQSEPLADSVIEVLRPKLIIVTDAEYPASQRASHRLRERLEAHGIPVFYTRDTGGITIRFTETSWELETMRGQ
jgi:ComEC/Rec2-related protein